MFVLIFVEVIVKVEFLVVKNFAYTGYCGLVILATFINKIIMFVTLSFYNLNCLISERRNVYGIYVDCFCLYFKFKFVERSYKFDEFLSISSHDSCYRYEVSFNMNNNKVKKIHLFFNCFDSDDFCQKINTF